MSIILASSNQHKAQEFAELFSQTEIKIVAATEKIEVDETGLNFNENAHLKAQAYFEKFKKPVMSDDSGIVVEALPEELGIYSARFGGEGLKDRQRAELLLEKLKDVKDSSREAYFVCVLCFYLNPQEILFFEGRVQGTISLEYRGDGGFGYDPVFLPERGPEGKTLAEIPEWKEIHSHRAVAVSKAIQFFESSAILNDSNLKQI